MTNNSSIITDFHKRRIYFKELKYYSALEENEKNLVIDTQNTFEFFINNVDEFDGNNVVISLSILRKLDYKISQDIGIDKTVDDFMRLYHYNDKISELKKLDRFFIHVNEFTYIIKIEDEILLFYQVLNNLERRSSFSRTCPIHTHNLENYYIILLESSKQNYIGYKYGVLDILNEEYESYKMGYDSVARDIILYGFNYIQKMIGLRKIGDLIISDSEELRQLMSIIKSIERYFVLINSGKKSLKPLSIVVFGPPGSGKSFKVKNIVRYFASNKKLEDRRIYTINVSQLNSVKEFYEKLADMEDTNSGIKFVFIDEFDAAYEGEPRGWLKYYLSIMEDGEYPSPGRSGNPQGNMKKINNCVLFFAGATSTSFKNFFPKTKEELLTFQNIKGTDFVSRIKGALDIISLNQVNLEDKSYIIRRAIVLRSALEEYAGDIIDENDRARISDALIDAFLYASSYKNEARSLMNIVMTSNIYDNYYSISSIPDVRQLALHIDAENFYSLIDSNLKKRFGQKE
ncbi:MAG: ATP-binding protein [Gallicola sp.]|nr:ATP-binding protein [Gallicola sp.]